MESMTLQLRILWEVSERCYAGRDWYAFAVWADQCRVIELGLLKEVPDEQDFEELSGWRAGGGA
jgi:hypothetical protein